MTERINLIRGLPTTWLWSRPALTDMSTNMQTRDEHTSSRPSCDRPDIYFFIHGFPDQPNSWSYQLQYFQHKAITVAPFLRGLNTTKSTPQCRFTLSSIVLDHLEILHQIDPNKKHKVVVFGHDIGALYAFELSKLLGDQLKTMILINGISLNQFISRMTCLRQLQKSWYIGLFQIPFLSEWTITKWGKFFGMDNQMRHCLKHYRKAFQQALVSFFHEEEPLKKPALVVFGCNDPYLEVPTKKEVAKLSTNTILRVLDGGHWIHRNKHDRVNKLIEKYLKEIA